MGEGVFLMHRDIIRACAAVAATAVLSALGVTRASASGAAIQAPETVRAPSLVVWRTPAVPGGQLWTQRYDGPAQLTDGAKSVAVSPSGSTVFITGSSMSASARYDYVTLAYDAATGARLWAQRYHGPRNDEATSVAVSPDGSTVFVTGGSEAAAFHFGYLTVAYDAATGAQLWAKRYDGPANRYDDALSLAVSPGGDTVFVTGESARANGSFDYATVAYNTATGAQLWAQRYNGPGNGDDQARSIAVSPNGDTVFVTGYSPGVTSGQDYATVAYQSTTGARLWVSRYNDFRNGDDRAYSVAVSPAGSTVFVTGTRAGVYATVAYNAATGARRWLNRYYGSYPDSSAYSVAVSPDGSTLFVTGESEGRTTAFDYATVAYNAATGAQLWARRYNGPGAGDYAYSVAVSADGSAVFVTGESLGATSQADYATVAYNAATGAQLWARRYNGPANGDDRAYAVAVSPNTNTVFVTGESQGAAGTLDYATIAYSG